MSRFHPLLVGVAFLGGLFGAAVGGLSAFLVCAVSVLVGLVVTAVAGQTSYDALVTWGPFLGPHVAFSGAVAAAAFAARQRPHGQSRSMSPRLLDTLLATGRDVVTPLWRLHSWPVLLVGGLFGAAGYLVAAVLGLVPAPGGLPLVNPIALSIVVVGIAARLVFGQTGLIGLPVAGHRIWRPVDEAAAFPWELAPARQVVVAVVVSVAAVSVGRLLPTAHGLVFGLSALTLGLLFLRVRVPITLHIAWAVEFLGFWTRDYGWGVAIGVLAVVLAIVSAHVLLLHADTHVDPPALAVAAVCSLCPVLSAMGALDAGLAASGAVAAGSAVAGWALLAWWQRRCVARGTGQVL